MDYDEIMHIEKRWNTETGREDVYVLNVPNVLQISERFLADSDEMLVGYEPGDPLTDLTSRVGFYPKNGTALYELVSYDQEMRVLRLELISWEPIDG